MTRDEILHIANRRGKSCYDLILEVYKEIDDGLNSRTCENCKYLKNDYGSKICTRDYFSFSGEGVCGYIGILDKDFGCNKFEEKDK